jgi:uncharacterized membrane protein YeiB
MLVLVREGYYLLQRKDRSFLIVLAVMEMSLTNYIGQSLSIVFFFIGLFLVSHNHTLVFAFGILFVLLQ